MMHANRSAVEMGIAVAGNSDSPVSTAEPLLRIQSMVTRKTAEGKVYGPEQRLCAEDAIRIWTMGSAYASFEQDIKGSIEVGKLADFVILSQDPTNVPPDTIKDIEVEKTYVGGKLAYEKG
ncbi:MAG: amidohydrolase family protein [Planctomycetota bacterium]|jgi:predicted amidohydrolase YtcJ